jgi:hypothetical protein
VGVLVHELGHIMDTGVLKGNFWTGESEFHDGKNAIYNDDPSLDFYRISFQDEKKLNKGVSGIDFVTGYAMTDPFEDFAETYNYYLLHGESFRELAKHNQSLAQKYDFMKEKVFAGKEFTFEDTLSFDSVNSRTYDSTIIGFNLQKFLAI